MREVDTIEWVEGWVRVGLAQISTVSDTPHTHSLATYCRTYIRPKHEGRRRLKPLACESGDPEQGIHHAHRAAEREKHPEVEPRPRWYPSGKEVAL